MMNENDNVTIPRDRYDELLDIETRVNVVVEMIESDGYMSTIRLLRTLGSEHAIDVANDIEKKMSNLTFKGVLGDESDD